MKKITKKLLALALALVMAVSLIPGAFAADTVASGKCGENLTWNLTDDGCLTISGEGEMTNFEVLPQSNTVPWKDHLIEIKSVSISEGVTSVGDWAFASCSSLTGVSLPETLKSIGVNAFGSCSALESLTIPEGVTSIGGMAFSACVSLAEVNLPGGITEIPSYLFLQCPISYIAIPQGVTSIGGGAFAYCDKLTAVSLPGTVTAIGQEAFAYCDSLMGVSISSACESIGEGAFMQCSSLAIMMIPAGVKEIGNYAFMNCPRLTQITVHDDNESYASLNGVLYNKDFTKLIQVPGGYTGSLEIPEGVEDIGQAIRFTGVSSVRIPASVRSVGPVSFDGCSNLTEIHFMGDRPEIDVRAFESVTATAYYPSDNETWADIEDAEFTEANITWSVEGSGTTPPDEPQIIHSGTVGTVTWDIYDDGVLDLMGEGAIPDFAAEGENAAPWQQYRDEITFIYVGEEITAIGENAFTGLTNVDEVDFLGDAPEIADNAFTGIRAYALFLIFANGWNEDTILNYGGELEWFYVYLYGDVDANGEVDNSDLITLARYIVRLWPEDSEEAIGCEAFADMNDDGAIDNADLVELALKVVRQ